MTPRRLTPADPDPRDAELAYLRGLIATAVGMCRTAITTRGHNRELADHALDVANTLTASRKTR